jgi:NAD+ diphosphatase
MSNHNVFAGAFVDRSGHRRKDPKWLRAAIDSPESRFVPVWGDKCLAGGDPLRTVSLNRSEVSEFLKPQETVFLGIYQGQPAFAVGIDGARDTPFPEAGEFHDLRYLGGVLPVDEANLTAHARALVLWHRLQKHCGVCGSLSRVESGGNTRICENKKCGVRSFPRVDPAIIVLALQGEQCLLGRQPSWPESRYSTIAGFVEPGESLEDAVRREVAEETNIEVGSVNYHSSQPWPFPSALMLGFTAEARSSEILLNDGELEDAQWFTRNELLSGVPKLPYRLSIARRLIDEWLQRSD